jgi:hypothetical protein
MTANAHHGIHVALACALYYAYYILMMHGTYNASTNNITVAYLLYFHTHTTLGMFTTVSTVRMPTHHGISTHAHRKATSIGNNSRSTDVHILTHRALYTEDDKRGDTTVTSTGSTSTTSVTIGVLLLSIVLLVLRMIQSRLCY